MASAMEPTISHSSSLSIELYAEALRYSWRWCNWRIGRGSNERTAGAYKATPSNHPVADPGSRP